MKATWRDLYDETIDQLGNAAEARWMIEEASGEPWLASTAPTTRARAHLDSMVERRLSGEPLQYVLGRWSFRSVELMIDPRVLIPRPETEQLVEFALREIDRLGRERPLVVDLGTGSGAIALSVAIERTNASVWATDSSPDALDVASANLSGIAGQAATRVRLVRGDWWSALPGRLKGEVDLVVSNPPYVSEEEMPTLSAEVRDWEPRTALESGERGLRAIRRILMEAPGWLRSGGTAVIEIAPHQSKAAVDAAHVAGFQAAWTEPDLAGRERALIARESP